MPEGTDSQRLLSGLAHSSGGFSAPVPSHLLRQERQHGELRAAFAEQEQAGEEATSGLAYIAGDGGARRGVRMLFGLWGWDFFLNVICFGSGCGCVFVFLSVLCVPSRMLAVGRAVGLVIQACTACRCQLSLQISLFLPPYQLATIQKVW